MKFSPLQIKTILNCYAGADHDPNGAVEEVLADFCEKSLINDENKITEKGLKWVRMICDTPIPVQRFIDPRTEDETL